jgi:hypothetical protein
MEQRLEMVGPNGLEPSTSSVSRKRSNQTELRAYTRTAVISILAGGALSGNAGLRKMAPSFLVRLHQTTTNLLQCIRLFPVSEIP